VYSIIETEDERVFAAVPGAEDSSAAITSLRADPDRDLWMFLLERNNQVVGRAGFFSEPTHRLDFDSDLPDRELNLFGPWLPWDDDDWLEAGVELLTAGVGQIDAPGCDYWDARVNPEVHDHADQRRRLMEAAGMSLFQEKHGYHWDDPGAPVVAPDRLRFRTITETGEDLYRDTLGRVGRGTLDRNDRWYHAKAGEANWAAVFVGSVGDGDAEMWLHGELADGTPVGFVAMADFSFDNPTPWDVTPCATVFFIGVVPEQRGNGYVDDLLLAGTAAAQRRGYRAVLSDVDVLNRPMGKAMERCGHRSDTRPWHVWFFRSELG
jgi:RimJ/RimL family protein N-acetyltransferase